MSTVNSKLGIVRLRKSYGTVGDTLALAHISRGFHVDEISSGLPFPTVTAAAVTLSFQRGNINRGWWPVPVLQQSVNSLGAYLIWYTKQP